MSASRSTLGINSAQDNLGKLHPKFDQQKVAFLSAGQAVKYRYGVPSTLAVLRKRAQDTTAQERPRLRLQRRFVWALVLLAGRSIKDGCTRFLGSQAAVSGPAAQITKASSQGVMERQGLESATTDPPARPERSFCTDICAVKYLGTCRVAWIDCSTEGLYGLGGPVHSLAGRTCARRS